MSVSVEFCKLKTGILVERPLDVPLAGEYQQVIALDILNKLGIGGEHQLLKLVKTSFKVLLAGYPADMLVWQTFADYVNVVLVLETVLKLCGSENIWIAPSWAIWVVPFMNCLRLRVSFWRIRAKCSGANVGIPSNLTFFLGEHKVSPIEKTPGSNTPIMSPAYASEITSRSLAIICCG